VPKSHFGRFSKIVGNCCSAALGLVAPQ